MYESHTIGIFLSTLGIYSIPSHKKSILLQAKQNNKNVSVNDLEPSKTVTIMKRNELMALIATTILMFAVCMSASAKGKRNVERGMTKQEVIAILGEPKLTSFDMYGDKWEYAKYNNLFGDSKYITVFFDRNGKVVQYDTRIIEPNSQTSNVQQPQHPTHFYFSLGKQKFLRGHAEKKSWADSKKQISYKTTFKQRQKNYPSRKKIAIT